MAALYDSMSGSLDITLTDLAHGRLLDAGGLFHIPKKNLKKIFLSNDGVAIFLLAGCVQPSLQG